MYSQPMLEIYADDVKCSHHGSTVGQLNEQALFYMQQRGISREEAQMLLKFAFAGDISSTPSPWRPCATACTIWWRSVSVAS